MDKRLLEWWRQPKKWAGKKATIAFWVFLSVFSVLLLWVMFGDKIGYNGCWIYEGLGVADKTEAIKLLGLAIAGVMAAGGVVAANRRADALADSAEAAVASAEAADNTAKAADNTAKAAEAGNRQRAFKDGVEHLGSEKPSVRQGGAHALFHLALEDEKLRASIAGVLCAHIRETTGDKDYQEEYKDKPSTEMQSLLRLLFTTETVDEGRLERFWDGITPDLNGGYFRGAELDSAQFRGAKLDSAQFQGARLEEVRFQGARLEGARFQGARLRGGQFQRALLGRAQFQRAQLERAQFQGARLGEAQFQRARLRGAQFQQALLGRAQFQRAWLGRAQFQRAWLGQAQFQRALLWEAQFQGARLRGAQFQGAWLKEAQFQRALLEGSQFQGASLEKSQFQGASLEKSRFQGASLEKSQFQGASLVGSQFQGAWLYMAGFQQAKFGQGSGHGDIPAQDRATAKPDELAEQLKASAFHGVSSGPLVLTSFEERINDMADKASDFSKVIFAGGVTKELLADIKEALERASWSPDDPDFNEKLNRSLESEIGQPESRELPKGLIAGSYGKEDAERWIREFREAMAKVPRTNQAA